MPRSLTDPVFTVIINVYNGERFLSEALLSVANQDFSNFEVVIWDNASTDQTAFICKEYCSQDSRFLYHRTEAHTTLYKARNKAIELARGKYIAFLDSDDIWVDKKLRSAFEALQGSRFAWFYSNFTHLNQMSGKLRKAYSGQLPSGAISEQLACNYTAALSTLVIRKSAVDQFAGPFIEDFNLLGDFDFLIRLSAQFEGVAINDPLVIYRTHEGNLSVKSSEMRLGEIQRWVAFAVSEGVLGVKTASLASMTLYLDWFLAEDGPKGRKILVLLSALANYLSISWIIGKLIWFLQNFLASVTSKSK